MGYRTDLALERKEILEEEGEKADEYEGILFRKTQYSDGVQVTYIEILDDKAAKKMMKPIGKYITIEAAGILEEQEGVKNDVERALAAELSNMIMRKYDLKVLVAGLGNKLVTPDSLGPETASKVYITRHLFTMTGADGDDGISSVSCVVPGVMATTGIETADIIKQAVEITNPDAVIIIDSLAARNIERVSTTIQLINTGISPGSGMGNNRVGINKETIGTEVIAIGVPTVIDVKTIIRDSLKENVSEAKVIDEYLDKYEEQMIVTSTDIDAIVKDFSEVIANGINITLHPGIYLH